MGRSTILLLATATLLAATGCGLGRPLSEEVREPAVGWNGGFEHARGDLPVNWLVYSPRTIPSGSYALVLDEEERKEGERSLRFDVASCEAGGGWRSPGIAAEVPAEAGATYDVSFWVRAEDCAWRASVGSVDAKTGARTTLGSEDLDATEWQRVERTLTVEPDHDRLRFDLNVLSPGRLWVDDVRLERVLD